MMLTNGCNKEKPNSVSDTVADLDGNVYHTIIIGTQVWMVENLKTTKYRNGASIKNITGESDWDTTTTGAWSYYMNDPQYNSEYGKFYNGFAVADPRKICPKNWHIPTDREWSILEESIISVSVSGALKEAGILHWPGPNSEATNSIGFTALPGGYRSGNGEFPFHDIDNLGSKGMWWSSTEIDTMNLWIRILDQYFEGIVRQNGDKNAGLSCRCIKDQ